MTIKIVSLSLRAFFCHCKRFSVIASVFLSLRAKRSNLKTPTSSPLRGKLRYVIIKVILTAIFDSKSVSLSY